MVRKGKAMNSPLKWMMTGGTPISGNHLSMGNFPARHDQEGVYIIATKLSPPALAETLAKAGGNLGFHVRGPSGFPPRLLRNPRWRGGSTIKNGGFHQEKKTDFIQQLWKSLF